MLHYAEIIADSVAMEVFALKMKATTRNYNTISRLVELSGG